MIPTAWNDRRRVVPRWHPLGIAVRLGETASGKLVEKNYSLSAALKDRLQRWRENPSLLSAAELVESAIVEGKETEGVAAARHLARIDVRAAPLVKKQAYVLLERTGRTDPAFVPQHSIAEWLGLWRRRTRQYPRDGLSWVELAFYQTLSGDDRAAERSMVTALGLAPNNRHIVRSASRFFLHIGDPGRAHDVFLKSDRTRHDPWLLGSEIAVAEVADRSSRLVKSGTRLLEQASFLPKHLSELSASIATLELAFGSRKKARKAFHQSLIDPTGNSLAQAEWASPELDETFAPTIGASIRPDFAEAMALHHFRDWRFEEVVRYCEVWAAEEPYSVRPYEFASASSGFAGDYEKSLEMASRGLRLRPNSSRLGNAKAFALGSLGRLQEAEDAFDDIIHEGLEASSILVEQANRGLIAFRRHDLEGGERHYLEAINGFRRIKDARLEASARVYLARESMLASHPEAERFREDAKLLWDKTHKRPNRILASLESSGELFVRAEESLPSFSLSHRITL